jgi:hypothetical protein
MNLVSSQRWTRTISVLLRAPLHLKGIREFSDYSQLYFKYREDQ